MLTVAELLAKVETVAFVAEALIRALIVATVLLTSVRVRVTLVDI